VVISAGPKWHRKSWLTRAFLRHIRTMTTSSPIAERVRPFLKNNTFFGGLPDNALDLLIRRGHIKRYSRGEVIYRRHDPGDSLMLILAGRVKITNVNANGKEVVLAFSAPGDLNGEIAVLGGNERTANVIAVEHSEAFVVYARDLLPILRAHPQVMLEIIQILCEKLRVASAIIEDNTLEMRTRTAKGLLRLAQQFGRTSKNGIGLDLVVSQSELGKYLSLSRANVSRQLGRLREANVIKLQGTQLVIIDEKGLSEIAEAAASKS
jgi:CRP/FNR family transcriptional regulator, cyclic AMP receptor protein